MADAKAWLARNAKKLRRARLPLLALLGLGAVEYVLERDLPPAPVKRHIRLRENSPFANEIRFSWDKAIPIRAGMNVDSLKGESGYVFRTDEHGFIMPAKIYDDPDLSLVFLGGSTIKCNYVEEESRFPYRAGLLLGRRLGKKINSYNAGVRANNSMHSLTILLNKVVPLQPDMVVMMHAINDVNILLFEDTYWNEHHTRSLIVAETQDVGRFTRLFEATMETFLPGFARRLRIGEAFGENADEFAETRGHKNVNTNLGTEGFEANLRSFIAVCRTRNIEPALMTQFNLLTEKPHKAITKAMKKLREDWGVDYAAYKRIYDRFNEATRKVAREHHVFLIDLDVLVPKEKKYFIDVVHLNTEGSKLVADIVASELAKNNEVQRLLATHTSATKPLALQELP